MCRVAFFFFLGCFQIIQAQPCLYLAYEPFDYLEGQPINELGGGSGWLSPWDVQGGNNVLPGYGTSTGSLTSGSLQAQGGHIEGGYEYLTAGRRFDLSSWGPFGQYVNNGGGIGSSKDGTIFMSGLIRKVKNNQENLFFSLHGESIPWYVSNPGPHIEIGYFGSASEEGGVKYWSIRLSNTVIKTAVPISIDEDVLLVIQLEFSPAVTTINYWVNPTSIGGGQVPPPTYSQVTNTPYSIRSLGLYLGSSPDNGLADEVRVASSYHCATPDENTLVNLPPVAIIQASASQGVAPFTIQLDGASSFDPEGGVLTYRWNFGDGLDVETGAIVEHMYEALGILQATLTVTDPNGLQQKANYNIKVLDEHGFFPCQSKFTVLNMAECGMPTGHIRVGVGNGVSVKVHSPSGDLLTATSNMEYSGLLPGVYLYTAAGDNGCRDTFNWHIEADSTACASWAVPECKMPIGTNLGGLADWSFERPFRNLMKHVRPRPIPYTENCFCWGIDSLFEELMFDPSGYPLKIPQMTSAGESYLRFVISTGGGNLRPGYTYLLLYDGTGVLQLQGTVNILSNVEGRVEFSATAAENIWFNLVYSSELDPVRNIRLIRQEDEGEDLTTAPFYGGFLEKIAPFKMLRFMDWGATNNNNIVHWGDRKDTSWFSYATSTGVPYEMMIRLANQSKKDVWICVPHAADDHFVKQMASLFKQYLDPSLTIYLEYSNEVWNWIFAQATYNDQHRPTNLNYARAYAEKARRVFKLWHDEFGTDKDRVKRVLGLQTLYNSLNEDILGQLDQGSWDIGAATHYIALNHSANGSPVLHAGSTASDVLENAENEWLSTISSIRKDYDQIRLFGKQIMTYEGGQHFVGNVFGVPYSYQEAMWDAQYNSGMYDLYDMVLDSIRSWGCVLAGNFSLAGKQESVYGSWGVLSDIDQEPPYFSTAPKYQALLDNISGDMSPVAFFEVEIDGFEVFFESISSDADHYWWDFGDGTFSENEDPMHIYSDTGSYLVRLTVKNECGTDTYIDSVFVRVSGEYSPPIDTGSILYPNPNNGQFQLRVDSQETMNIEIFNFLGEVLYSEASISGPSPQINAPLPPGVYLLVWSLNGNYSQARFVIK